jgi:hypothetical protein
MQDLITSILGGTYLPPDAPGPDGRPAAYKVAEWQANECATLADAIACRDYLASWPEGPQGGTLPVARVAVILDLTREAIQQQIARGYVHAVKVGKVFLVPLGEVERWRPVKAGRPRAEGKVVLPAMTATGSGHQIPAPKGWREPDMKK